MSDQQTSHDLQQCLQRLLELTKPNRNDVRHARYANYTNAFLEPLGDERAYLVGSTGEITKLRWSTDGGDSDFVLVSGKFKVPIESIEHRPGAEDYIWIRTDALKTDVKSLDTSGAYLCPDVLKTVGPGLFTTLRGLYTLTTATTDSIPGRTRRITTTAESSKVGLARSEYENLNFDGIDIPVNTQKTSAKIDRDKLFALYLKNRWLQNSCPREETQLLKRLFMMIGSCKVPGHEDGFGKFLSFASIVDAALKRPPIESAEITGEEIVFDNDVDMDSDDDSAEKVRATYTRVSSKDFVPALRVDGKLSYMDAYMERVRNASWPGHKLAEEVYNSDVFVVARLSPIQPDRERDFRLSFNLAEILLVKQLPTTARNIYIILKAYLKGSVRELCKSKGQKNKLRSYHMKTALLWLCEQYPVEFWREDNMLVAVQVVLKYVQTCLQEERLEHYFIRSNLFTDFTKSDFLLLSEGISKIIEYPVRSINAFFELDQQTEAVVWLKPAEIDHFKSMKADGGKGKNMNQVEDAIIDILRGINESPRGMDGELPFKAALLSAVDVFLADEKRDEEKKRNEGATRRPNDVQMISGFLNQLVTDGGTQSYNSRDASQKLDLVVGLASLFPAGKKVLDEFGGKRGLQNVLQASNDVSRDKRTRLRAAIKKFLDCDEREETDVGLELKQELVAYFIGRDGP